MDLTTRCPKCNTVFKASLADLQLRKGYIRCVQCAYIFDGYAEVVSESGKEPFLEEDNLAPADHEHDLEPAFSADYSIDNSYETEQLSSQNTRTDPDFRIADSDQFDDTEESFSINLGNNHKSAQTDSFILEADPNRRRGGSAYSAAEPSAFMQATGRLFSWILLSILVLLVIFQLVYIYRAQIAQNFIFTRPALEKYCSYLDCNVPYLRDIDSLVITRSALKLIKPKAEDESSTSETDKDQEESDQESDKSEEKDQDQPEIRDYELQFNLRNLAKQPQEWPTIVLNLKDSSGQIQIKRNLTPKDYLTDITPAIPAQSETFVSLPVQLKGDTQVNGFHLDLFFP